MDEAHYIKNPDAKRTVKVKKIGRHADRLLFMTGTALENKADEMVALIRILQPDIASQVSGMTFLSYAPLFREKIAPVYYRRKREDVLTELPELIERNEWCTMLSEEELIYEESILSRRYADARRVSWNVTNLNKSSKANRLQEIAREAKDNERKVLVFSFFLDTISKVVELLGDRCLAPIKGSVPPQRRQEIIDEFEHASPGTVLVSQIQSGGTGLNIQSASVVVICEPQFKPSTEQQAISRAYRMGQTRNVLVYRLLSENTIDERITSILESKKIIFNAFADKSVAAMESMELDDKTFSDIIKEEIDRINSKRGKAPNSSNNKVAGSTSDQRFHKIAAGAPDQINIADGGTRQIVKMAEGDTGQQDYLWIIEELERRYPKGAKFRSVQELRDANSDLVTLLDQFQSESARLVGMSDMRYFRNIGLLEPRHRPDQ